jgi:hypothetical protein
MGAPAGFRGVRGAPVADSDLGAEALGLGASESRDDRDTAVDPGFAAARSLNHIYVANAPPMAIARTTAITRLRPITQTILREWPVLLE